MRKPSSCFAPTSCVSESTTPAPAGTRVARKILPCRSPAATRSPNAPVVASTTAIRRGAPPPPPPPPPTPKAPPQNAATRSAGHEHPPPPPPPHPPRLGAPPLTTR